MCGVCLLKKKPNKKHSRKKEKVIQSWQQTVLIGKVGKRKGFMQEFLSKRCA